MTPDDAEGLRLLLAGLAEALSGAPARPPTAEERERLARLAEALADARREVALALAGGDGGALLRRLLPPPPPGRA